MKFMNWLFLTLSVVAYAHKTEGDDKMRSNHSDCFDVFIPLINRLSNEAKEASANCVASANAERERELTAIKNTRSELFSEVKRIKETLAHCSSRNDHLGYFECLNGIIEVDKKIVGDITLKSSLYSKKLKHIEEQELRCFQNSVLKIKDKISKGIINLQNCLMSEDTSTSTSGEKLEHGFDSRHSATDSPADILPPIFSETTSYPESRYDDYDYNSNNY